MKTNSMSASFWKAFWLAFLVISLGFAWYSFYTPSAEIAWSDDIDSAQEQASKTDKKTILFFTAKWCSPCRIMKREVLSDNEVEEILDVYFIPVKIDINKAENNETVEVYKVKSTPTTLIIDSSGRVVDYAVGRITKKKFIEMLSGV